MAELSGRQVVLPDSRVAILTEPHVLVVGGASEGLAAATASARSGAVLYPSKNEWDDPSADLVERYSRWGLVWGRGPRRVRCWAAFEPHELILAADEMLSEAGVCPLCHTRACEPVVEGGVKEIDVGRLQERLREQGVVLE